MMINKKPAEQGRNKRLFYIDFRLRFLGSINRMDLVKRFAIQSAAATRDISLYKTRAPHNLIYDPRRKCYRHAAGFCPLFAYDHQQAIMALCHGLGDDQLRGTPLLAGQAEPPLSLNPVQLDILATISRAIHQGHPVQLHYLSLNRGLCERVITPFVMVDTGQRWHVRAFDHNRQNFRDFVINRMTRARALTDEAIPERHRLQHDTQWQRHITLHLVPHPGLRHPEVIQHELSMSPNGLKLKVRAALAGYVLQRWHVDCAKQPDQQCLYLLRLNNPEVLQASDTFILAPGHRSHDITPPTWTSS